MVGIIRPIDKLGRFSIPKEALKRLSLRKGDMLEVFYGHDGALVLKRSCGHCAFCGTDKNIRPIASGCVCLACAEHFRKMP